MWHLEGEGLSLLSDFLHEEVNHLWLGGVASGGVNLDALDPDVSPEGQAHDIQVIASIAEGTGEVDEHCQDKEKMLCDLLFFLAHYF